MMTFIQLHVDRVSDCYMALLRLFKKLFIFPPLARLKSHVLLSHNNNCLLKTTVWECRFLMRSSALCE